MDGDRVAFAGRHREGELGIQPRRVDRFADQVTRLVGNSNDRIQR